MLAKVSIKIDKYYFFLGLVLLALAAVVIFTIRGIFSSLNTASEIDESVGWETRVNRSKLDNIYETVFSK